MEVDRSSVTARIGEKNQELCELQGRLLDLPKSQRGPLKEQIQRLELELEQLMGKLELSRQQDDSEGLLRQPARESEYDRYARKFSEAMWLAESAGWPLDRRLQVGGVIEQAIAKRGIPESGQQAAASHIVSRLVEREEHKAEQKQRGLHQILAVVAKDRQRQAKIQAISVWSGLSFTELAAGFDRLYDKYTQAMLCARKYNWPQSKCIKAGAQIEASVHQKGLEPGLAASAAVEFIVAAIKAEKKLEQRRARGLHRVVALVTREERKTSLQGPVVAWSDASSGEVGAAYDRLYSKYTRAMLCARNYEWSRLKCVDAGQKIDAEISQKGIVSEDEQAAVAIDLVVAAIKAEKLLEKQRAWAMGRFVRVFTKQHDRGSMGEAVRGWAVRAGGEVQAEYKQYYDKYTRAMLCGRKYQWSQAKCIKAAAALEAENTRNGVVGGKEEAAAAIEYVTALIKEELKAEALAKRASAQSASS